MPKKYVQDPHTNKIYMEEVLVPVTAVDPFKWDTDIQNHQDQIVALKQKAIDDEAALNEKIATAQAEKVDFFNQFPELKPE